MNSRSTKVKEQLGLGLELLSSKERRHYSKALKEMYELVKLEALRRNLTPSGSEDEYQDDTATNATNDDYSGNSSERSDAEDIETSEPCHARKQQKHVNVKKIYKELSEISQGLQKENQRLKKWDAELSEKKSQNELLQKKLKNYEDTLDELINFECEKRCKEVEKAMEERMVEITEESKRTKLSFKIMKQANDTIKKQNSQLEEQNKKLEEKVSSLSHRITNLQRKNEIIKKQLDDGHRSVDKITKAKGGKDEEAVDIQMKKIKADMSACSEALNTCLEWVAECQLKQAVDNIHENEERDSGENDVSTEITSERAFKVLQQLSLIPNAVTTQKFQLPFVQFVYWSLMHAYRNQNRKGGIPVSTYRRIGEEIYKSQASKSDSFPETTADSTAKREGAFLHSSDIQIRMLSALIIMKTLNQADILARVLEVLKIDTREEKGKYIFVTHHGSSVLISYLKGSHKGLLNFAVDVLMQMTVESPYLSSFLTSLSTLSWIRTFYELFQTKWVETNLMEKVSIVLQRLSKIKSNQRHFDSLQFPNLIRELALNCDSEKPFLALNLRSILLNLNAKAPGTIGRKQMAK